MITHKLNLTVGITPALSVAAGLVGFFIVKTWTGFLSKLGFYTKPFTRQENTVIQSCVVACNGVAFGGGFFSSVIAMDERTYELIRPDYTGNRADDIKNPGLVWLISFMFIVSFLGPFSLAPLRSTLTSVQLMLDVVSSVLTWSIVHFFLEPSYLGVSCGPLSLAMLGTGTQIILMAMTLKALVGIRCGKIIIVAVHQLNVFKVELSILKGIHCFEILKEVQA